MVVSGIHVRIHSAMLLRRLDVHDIFASGTTLTLKSVNSYRVRPGLGSRWQIDRQGVRWDIHLQTRAY